MTLLERFYVIGCLWTSGAVIAGLMFAAVLRTFKGKWVDPAGHTPREDE